MKPIKFLIVNDTVRFRAVDYHRHLLTPDDNFSQINGGGMIEFDFNNENKTIRFDGGSADYGTFKPVDLKEAIKNTPDIESSLTTLGKLGYGDDFDISKCRIFVRDEEIKL